MQYFIQNRIDTLFITNRRKYDYYLDLISDLFYSQIEKGINQNSHIRKKVYHGFLKLSYRAADKITLDRYESSYNYTISVSKINKSDDEFYTNKIKEMFFNCLEVENNSDVPTRQLFFEYLLFALGNKKFNTLDPSITDEMLEYWYQNFKISYLLFFPTDIFTQSNYGDFNLLHNCDKYSALEIINNSNCCKDYISFLGLVIETTIYSPYINLY